MAFSFKTYHFGKGKFFSFLFFLLAGHSLVYSSDHEYPQFPKKTKKGDEVIPKPSYGGDWDRYKNAYRKTIEEAQQKPKLKIKLILI